MQRIYHQSQSVQITVYEAKPKGSRHETNHKLQRASHRHPALRNAGAGYDRKEKLLHYSRQLRAAACREQPAASVDRSQHLHKVKEVLQITSIHKPQHKVTEILQITSSRNPYQHKVMQDRLQICSSQEPQQGADAVLQFTRSRNSHHKAKEVRRISRSSSWKVVPVEHRPPHAEVPQSPPSCFGYWKRILLPQCFVKSHGDPQAKKHRGNPRKKYKKKLNAGISLSDRMNAVVMSSRMEKDRLGNGQSFLGIWKKSSLRKTSTFAAYLSFTFG